MFVTPVINLNLAFYIMSFFKFTQLALIIKSLPFTTVTHVSINLHAVIWIWSIVFTPFIDLGRTLDLVHFWNIPKLALAVKRRPATAFVFVPVTIVTVFMKALFAQFFLVHSFTFLCSVIE